MGDHKRSIEVAIMRLQEQVNVIHNKIRKLDDIQLKEKWKNILLGIESSISILHQEKWQ